MVLLHIYIYICWRCGGGGWYLVEYLVWRIRGCSCRMNDELWRCNIDFAFGIMRSYIKRRLMQRLMAKGFWSRFAFATTNEYNQKSHHCVDCGPWLTLTWQPTQENSTSRMSSLHDLYRSPVSGTRILLLLNHHKCCILIYHRRISAIFWVVIVWVY